MLIGGGTCSTAGGIKHHRVYLLVKSIAWDVRSRLLLATTVMAREARDGERRVPMDDQRLRQTGTFVFLYLVTWIAVAFVMTAYGYPLRDSLFEAASTIGAVGLSVGVTSSSTPNAVLCVQVPAMLLGRLEFFVVLSAFVRIVRLAGRRGP